MQKFLTDVADHLISNEETSSPCYICEEEGLEILNYIFEKTGKKYMLILCEEDTATDTLYSCYILESESLYVRFEDF